MYSLGLLLLWRLTPFHGSQVEDSLQTLMSRKVRYKLERPGLHMSRWRAEGNLCYRRGCLVT